MNAAKKVAPKRKAKDKRNDKGGNKASKAKKRPAGTKTPRKGQRAAGVASDDDDEEVFVNRRAKKPKTGRIGRWDRLILVPFFMLWRPSEIAKACTTSLSLFVLETIDPTALTGNIVCT